MNVRRRSGNATMALRRAMVSLTRSAERSTNSRNDRGKESVGRISGQKVELECLRFDLR